MFLKMQTPLTPWSVSPRGTVVSRLPWRKCLERHQPLVSHFVAVYRALSFPAEWVCFHPEAGMPGTLIFHAIGVFPPVVGAHQPRATNSVAGMPGTLIFHAIGVFPPVVGAHHPRATN